MTASAQLTNIGLTAGWETGEDFWGGPMNQNIVALDTLLFLRIVQAASNAPPLEVTDGQTFLVANNPTGPWAGQAGKVATLYAGSWGFFTPKDGWRAKFVHLNRFYTYNGTTWVDEITGFNPDDPAPPETGPQYWDCGVTIRDQILASEVIVHLPMLSPVFLTANMVGSSLDIITSLGVDTGLLVYRNNTLVGNISLPAGQFNATFTTVGGQPVTYGIGDRLTIRGPSVSVPDFKYFGLNLRFNVVG